MQTMIYHSDTVDEIRRVETEDGIGCERAVILLGQLLRQRRAEVASLRREQEGKAK